MVYKFPYYCFPPLTFLWKFSLYYDESFLNKFSITDTGQYIQDIFNLGLTGESYLRQTDFLSSCRILFFAPQIDLLYFMVFTFVSSLIDESFLLKLIRGKRNITFTPQLPGVDLTRLDGISNIGSRTREMSLDVFQIILDLLIKLVTAENIILIMNE